MSNIRRGREALFPYDHELERTLCNMNQNLGINDDDPNQLLPDAPGEKQQRGQNPSSRPQAYYRGYDNMQTPMG